MEGWKYTGMRYIIIAKQQIQKITKLCMFEKVNLWNVNYISIKTIWERFYSVSLNMVHWISHIHSCLINLLLEFPQWLHGMACADDTSRSTCWITAHFVAAVWPQDPLVYLLQWGSIPCVSLIWIYYLFLFVFLMQGTGKWNQGSKSYWQLPGKVLIIYS